MSVRLSFCFFYDRPLRRDPFPSATAATHLWVVLHASSDLSRPGAATAVQYSVAGAANWEGVAAATVRYATCNKHAGRDVACCSHHAPFAIHHAARAGSEHGHGGSCGPIHHGRWFASMKFDPATN